MALFPQRFIEDLKQQADIVVVIQDYVSLKKTGATYKGLCPFHGEKTPSFHVNRDKGFFHCFGCGVGGDVIKFLELHEKNELLKQPHVLLARQLEERDAAEVAERAAARLADELSPIDDVRSTADYRRAVASRILHRLIREEGGW